MYNLDPNDQIVKLVTRVMSDLNLKPNIKPSGGGTDANVMRHHGIECVVVGMSTNEMHTINEYVVIPDLVNTAIFCQNVLTAKP
jgi:tripeptide aminopeptidase